MLMYVISLFECLASINKFYYTPAQLILFVDLPLSQIRARNSAGNSPYSTAIQISGMVCKITLLKRKLAQNYNICLRTYSL